MNVKFFNWDYLHLTALMKETYFSMFMKKYLIKIKELFTNKIVRTSRSMWARSMFRIATFTLYVEIHTVTGTIINFVLWCYSQVNWSFLFYFATVTSIQVSKWIIKGTSYKKVELTKKKIFW